MWAPRPTSTAPPARCIMRLARPEWRKRFITAPGQKNADDIGRGEHQIDDGSQDHELQPDRKRRRGIDELRQERHEKDRRLRVQHLDGDALEKGAACRISARCAGTAARIVVAGAKQVEAEPDQIGSAEQASPPDRAPAPHGTARRARRRRQRHARSSRDGCRGSPSGRQSGRAPWSAPPRRAWRDPVCRRTTAVVAKKAISNSADGMKTLLFCRPYTERGPQRHACGPLRQKEKCLPRYFFTVAATSAAKSVTSFSMPSPSA